MSSEAMFDVACDLFVEHIGSQFSVLAVSAELILLYGISSEESVVLSQSAFDEWVEAYS